MAEEIIPNDYPNLILLCWNRTVRAPSAGRCLRPLSSSVVVGASRQVDGQRARADPVARDRLLAHERQDASHAVIRVGSLTKEVASLKRLIMLLIGLTVVLLAIELARFVL